MNIREVSIIELIALLISVKVGYFVQTGEE